MDIEKIVWWISVAWLPISLVIITFLVGSNFRLKSQNTTDSTTGLLNKRGFDRAVLHAVQRTQRDCAPITLLLLDLNWFKQYNDTRGHKDGDLLLRGFGETLRGFFRTTDVVSRWGGDEFAVLLHNVGSEVGQQIIKTKLVPLLEGFFSSFGVAASIGTASASGRPNEISAVDQVNDLFRRADEALFEAKKRKGPEHFPVSSL
ncbi:MAG: GGDEF domain-containing protein [Candidatus Margulisiibacteriota bacterium]|jgi:diguanylate cyclase (GGDEF)-like protein